MQETKENTYHISSLGFRMIFPSDVSQGGSPHILGRVLVPKEN